MEAAVVRRRGGRGTQTSAPPGRRHRLPAIRRRQRQRRQTRARRGAAVYLVRPQDRGAARRPGGGVSVRTSRARGQDDPRPLVRTRPAPMHTRRGPSDGVRRARRLQGVERADRVDRVMERPGRARQVLEHSQRACALCGASPSCEKIRGRTVRRSGFRRGLTRRPVHHAFDARHSGTTALSSRTTRSSSGLQKTQEFSTWPYTTERGSIRTIASSAEKVVQPVLISVAATSDGIAGGPIARSTSISAAVSPA